MVDHCFFHSYFHFIFFQFSFVEIFFHQSFVIAGDGFYQFLVQVSSALAFSSSGIGNFSGLPPASLNLYIVIRSTSMIA